MKSRHTTTSFNDRAAALFLCCKPCIFNFNITSLPPKYDSYHQHSHSPPSSLYNSIPIMTCNDRLVIVISLIECVEVYSNFEQRFERYPRTISLHNIEKCCYCQPTLPLWFGVCKFSYIQLYKCQSTHLCSIRQLQFNNYLINCIFAFLNFFSIDFCIFRIYLIISLFH